MPGDSSVPANRDPHMTVLAPSASALAMCPARSRRSETCEAHPLGRAHRPSVHDPPTAAGHRRPRVADGKPPAKSVIASAMCPKGHPEAPPPGHKSQCFGVYYLYVYFPAAVISAVHIARVAG